MAAIDEWMTRALALAAAAGAAGEVPVGAVVVGPSGELLGEGWNARAGEPPDPTAHAEVVAIRAAAAALGRARLDGCTLVVTLEPCTMCAGAVLQSRLSRLVFGAWDEKAGAVGGRLDVIRESGLPHVVEVVGGVREVESAAMLRDFFAQRR